MTIDDPCDELPQTYSHWLWGTVMLKRTTDPFQRRAIRFGMNQTYGRIPRQASRRDDPCDDWSASIAVRWVPAMDRRTRSDHYKLQAIGRGLRQPSIVADDSAFIDHSAPPREAITEFRPWSLDKRDKS